MGGGGQEEEGGGEEFEEANGVSVGKGYIKRFKSREEGAREAVRK